MSYCVYFLKKNNEIVYIGITNNLRRRLWEHGKDKFEVCRSIKCIDRKTALHYEKRLISYFRPVLNSYSVSAAKVTISTKLDTAIINVLKLKAAQAKITLSKYLGLLVEEESKLRGII